jgi:hypothetical protein
MVVVLSGKYNAAKEWCACVSLVVGRQHDGQKEKFRFHASPRVHIHHDRPEPTVPARRVWAITSKLAIVPTTNGSRFKLLKTW